MLLGSATEIEQWAQTSEQKMERVAEKRDGWMGRWMQVIIATVKGYVNSYCVILHK